MQTNIPELRAVHNFFRRGLNLVEYAGLLAIAFATTFALYEEVMLMVGAGNDTTRSASNRNKIVRGPHPGCVRRTTTILASNSGSI